MKNARILLVEDEKKIANALSKGLSENGYAVTVANDGLEGKLLGMSKPFEMAIIDVGLPRMDGISLCRDLRKTNSDIPVLMLTALGSMEQKLEGFEAGADDYLLKPFEFRELLARIKVLLKRSNAAPEEQATLTISDLQLNVQTRELQRDGNKIHLTTKEYQLLEYFLRNQNRLLTRSEISKNVWGIDFDTQTNMIDVYINFLRKKIDKNYPVKLLHTIVGMGYILKQD